MLVKRIWLEREGKGMFIREWHREGWYLFGFIPLYIRDLSVREPK